MRRGLRGPNDILSLSMRAIREEGKRMVLKRWCKIFTLTFQFEGWDAAKPDPDNFSIHLSLLHKFMTLWILEKKRITLCFLRMYSSKFLLLTWFTYLHLNNCHLSITLSMGLLSQTILQLPPNVKKKNIYLYSYLIY